MVIGIPTEILEREHRVAALPEEVAAYVRMGFDVIVQVGAGEGALHADDEYAAAGARIVGGLVRAGEEPGFSLAPAPGVPDAGPEGVAGRRILVVDDNASQRRILDERLQSWGARAVLAESGAAALADAERTYKGTGDTGAFWPFPDEAADRVHELFVGVGVLDHSECFAQKNKLYKNFQWQCLSFYDAMHR